MFWKIHELHVLREDFNDLLYEGPANRAFPLLRFEQLAAFHTKAHVSTGYHHLRNISTNMPRVYIRC